MILAIGMDIRHSVPAENKKPMRLDSRKLII